MYPHHLGEAVQQQQQQNQTYAMTTQPPQQIVGSKRPLSEESDNSENINVQTAPKRFHPMDPKSGDSPTRESGEDGVEESADEEEEDESNGSSDAEPNHQPMNSAINFGYTAGPPVHAMANPSMGSSAMAHPYQFQNMAQNFFGRAVTSQQQQFPPFDFPNAYQMRPLIDKKTIANADQSTILRNLQNFYWSPSVFSSPPGSHLQQHQQPHNYGTVQAKSMEGAASNSQMMAQRPLISFGPISSTHPTQYVPSPSSFALQQLSGNGTRANALTTHVPQGTPSVERSDSSINNDSGLGLTDRSGKGDSKNESSSTDDTANFVRDEFGTQQNSTANKFVQFVPFIRSVSIDGVQRFCDLEQIVYSETPARLTLLGNMTKYPITLAEIVRRVSPPECLNTSFLSGILRRAKNKDGGKRFRMELQRFNCGVDLQTGRRKTGAITTFTALCERESIQLAKDFDKLVKDEHNGFPDKALANELIRKAAMNSLKEPPNSAQLLGNFQNASNILRDAIQLLEGAIEQETGELVSVTAAELIIQQQQQANAIDGDGGDLMNRFKRFARLSHCFGNRGMLCAWQILLSVFTNCESDLQRMSNSNYPSVELKQRKQATMALPADFTAADLSTLQAQGSSSWMS